jgi:hypothetical protein
MERPTNEAELDQLVMQGMSREDADKHTTGEGPPGRRREFIDTAGWRATTSPEYAAIPHEYTVRGRETSGKTVPVAWFDWFASEIRTHGYKRQFTNPNTGRTYVYTYLDAEDGQGRWHKYWAFQTIINREPLKTP